MRAAILVCLAVVAGGAAAAPVAPTAPLLGPWVRTSCWVDHRWFETLRNGPVDYCKRSLRYRPGRIDCIAYTDEICWAVNQVTGEYQQLRTEGLQSLIVCPDGPEPPTCPRLR